MTREDLDREYLIGMYSKYSKSAIFDHLVYAIDYIESIKSRTCESCRHFQNKINEEEITCNYHCGFYPIKYKHCGYWESKDNPVEKFSKMVHKDD
jgi:hypothetical protein